MTRGIEAATTGLLNASRSIDVISNNITNSGTAGFKKDAMVTSSFGDHMLYKLGGGENGTLGTMTYGCMADEVFTSYEQGSLQQTGRTLDFAIEGEGFFTIQQENGDKSLTRNGQFLLNQDGYLTDVLGNVVLGLNGPIHMDSVDFNVTGTGEILAGETYIDKLLITCPKDLSSLVKKEGVITMDMSAMGESEIFTGNIKQGCIESANTDVASEMADLIASSRSFQSCSQLIKMMDGILEKSVNEIARL